MCYKFALATPGNTATSGTANTETEVFQLTPGTYRPFWLQRLTLTGKAAGATSLSGILLRILHWATGSTSGTSFTPTPTDLGYEACKATGSSAPTAGSTRTNYDSVGCGVGGPGAYVAMSPDEAICTINAATTPSLDAVSVSGTASLNFEWGGTISE